MLNLITRLVRVLASQVGKFLLIAIVMMGIYWLVTAYGQLAEKEKALGGLHEARRLLEVKLADHEKGLQGLDLKRKELEEPLRKRLTDLRYHWAELKNRSESICRDFPIRCRVPLSEPYKQRQSLEVLQIPAQETAIKGLEKARQVVIGEISLAEAGEEAKTALREHAPGSHQALVEIEKAHAEVQEIRRELEAKRDQIRQAHGEIESNWWRRLRDGVFDSFQNVFLGALAVYLSVTLVPYAIRAFFFFVLAPAASRRPPLRIDASDTGRIEPSTPSGVSISVTLRGHEALIARTEFVQSASTAAVRKTRWLLDWRHMATSAASGLYALEQIEGDGATVVVSPVKDPLLELAMIDIPEGASIVFKPRGLVGVVCPADRPPRIVSAWRLNHLHAWLTLQFRYLVFHGPVRLISKGCRGVRIESASGGKAISQDATLGFSAGLRYSNGRGGPFLSYARGARALFEDRFDGAQGCFVYEETPRHEQRAGISGRGLEGVADAVLKVFGI